MLKEAMRHRLRSFASSAEASSFEAEDRTFCFDRASGRTNLEQGMQTGASKHGIVQQLQTGASGYEVAQQPRTASSEHVRPQRLFGRTILASAALLGMLLLSSCAQESSPSMADMYDTSEGVAATVNGTEIGEAAVTAYVTSYRSAMGLEDDDYWAAWLVSNDLTAEGIRSQALDYYVSVELVYQAAGVNGLSVSEEDIDAAVQEAKDSLGEDEDWDTVLAELGLTEEEYRWDVEFSLYQDAIITSLSSTVSVTDDDVLAYLQENASSFDGMKRISYILFDEADADQASEVLAQIQSGEIDFASAAEQYASDSSLTASDGDAGWGVESSLPSDCQEALEGMEVGDTSDPISTDAGTYLLMVTDQVSVSSEIASLDDLPEDFQTYIYDAASNTVLQDAYTEYMSEFQSASTIVLNDMPEGLPYDVDLSAYEEDNAYTADEVPETTSSEDSSTETSDDSSDASSNDTADE